MAVRISVDAVDSFTYESLDSDMKESFGRTVLKVASSLDPSQLQSPSLLFPDPPVLRLAAFKKGTKTPLSLFLTPPPPPLPSTRKKIIVIASGLSKSSPPLNQSTDSESSSTIVSTTAFDLPSFVTNNSLKISLPSTSSAILKSDIIAKDETVATDTGNTKPLPLKLARYLSSCYVMFCRRDNGNQEQLPELWLLCDEEKTCGKVLALGCVPSEKEIRLYQVSEGKKPVVITNCKIFSIRAESLLTSTQCLQRRKGSSGDKTLSRSLYHFGFDIDEDNEAIPTKSHISLEFKWEPSSPVFTSPPTSSEVVLNISSTPGYPYSPVLPVFKELQLLISLAEIYSGEREWSQVDNETENVLSSAKPCSLSSMVDSFLTEVSSGLKAADSTLISPSALVSLFQSRDDSDFTDQLWSFLKNVTSLSDLTDTFSSVFMSVLMGRIQPFIQQDKKSTLANLFRLSLLSDTKEKLEVTATKLQALLTREKSLKALVEIGIEKMERDYVWYFVSNNLASKSDIMQFFPSETAPLLERVHMLSSLHCVLELTADLNNFFALPKNRVTSFVRSVLRYYCDVPVARFATTPTFSITFSPVSPEVKALATFASSLPPSHLSLESQSGSIVATSEPLFKYVYGSQKVEEDLEQGNNSMYVYSANVHSLSL